MSDIPAMAPKTAFKVLMNGKSFHGGSFEWSLPTADGQPGQKHSLCDGMPPAICHYGFHLTRLPAAWFQQGATVYLAEYEGLISQDSSSHSNDPTKIAVQHVRLLREATPAELAAHGIFTSGEHNAAEAKLYHASGSAKVTAYDSAQVTASGSAKVTAYGSAQVTASGSAKVTAYGSAQVTASDSAQVTASGSAKVTASGSAQVTASDSAQVTAEGKSTVLLHSPYATVKLVGLAVAVDWTKQIAELLRANPEATISAV